MLRVLGHKLVLCLFTPAEVAVLCPQAAVLATGSSLVLMFLQVFNILLSLKVDLV